MPLHSATIMEPLEAIAANKYKATIEALLKAGACVNSPTHLST
ncbi:MAG: hypothetical protein ACJARD_000296 [Alphaproteobacteria bacterium]|jgi:hypothetical protein